MMCKYVKEITAYFQYVDNFSISVEIRTATVCEFVFGISIKGAQIASKSKFG